MGQAIEMGKGASPFAPPAPFQAGIKAISTSKLVGMDRASYEQGLRTTAQRSQQQELRWFSS
jgi:hypothetical protein